MDEITFTGYIGDTPIHVNISPISGAGGDMWHLYIDSRYLAKIMKRNDEWVVVEQIKLMQIDDMQVLIELVKAHSQVS